MFSWGESIFYSFAFRSALIENNFVNNAQGIGTAFPRCTFRSLEVIVLLMHPVYACHFDESVNTYFPGSERN